MKNVYLVTFGTTDPNNGYKTFKKSLLRLKNEALDTNWFKDIFLYTETDLAHFDKSFAGTGAGWWWWKPIVVKMALDSVKTDDIVMFIDAGFTINKEGEERFFDYVRLCDSGPGILGFGGGPISSVMGEGDTDGMHAKRDLLIYLDCDSDKYTKTSQSGSGLFFIKKNKFGLDFLNEWMEISKNEHFLNHAPSLVEEHSEFLSHKNEQAIFSLLLKKRLPQLNNYLLDKREVSEHNTTFGYASTPFKADRLDDSKLWSTIPYKIHNGKLVRGDFNYK
jgi:hypothetical protein